MTMPSGRKSTMRTMHGAGRDPRDPVAFDHKDEGHSLEVHDMLKGRGFKHIKTTGSHSVYEHPTDGLAVVNHHNGHVHLHHSKGYHAEYNKNETHQIW